MNRRFSDLPIFDRGGHFWSRFESYMRPDKICQENNARLAPVNAGN